jgi:Transposase
MKEERFAWFVGIDWGSEKHQACVLDQQGDIAGERSFPHSGVGLAELSDWILSIVGAANAVAVAIEVPHGPVVDSLIDRGFVVHTINPKQLDRLRDRFSVAGAKDDRRDGYVLADGVRTDRRLFRRLSVADPRIIELRAWSRLTQELTEERVRLSNRVHHELWRYFPQLPKLTDDLAASWFLELWTLAPTPARRLRKSTVEQLLKQHRIRRVDAETVIRTLREPAIKVADGVAEAASVHIRSLIARLRVINRELREAEGQLDKICTAIGESEAVSGECLQRQDVMILKSMPGIGRINLLRCCRKVPDLSADGIIRRFGHCAARLPSLGAAESRKLSSCVTLLTFGCATRSIIGHVLPANTTPRARAAMPPYVSAVTRTDVRCVV